MKTDRNVRIGRIRAFEARGGRRAEPDGLQRGIAGAGGDGLADRMDAYLESLRVQHYSEQTVKSHREALVQWVRWAYERDVYQSAEVTRPLLESYQRWLYRYRKPDGRALAPATQRSRLSFIKSYFKWLCRQHILVHNPASEIDLPREEKRLPQEPLSLQQVDAVLNAPDVAEPLGLRDRAILEVFYSTGIRRSELTRLEIQDVNLDRRTLQICLGKGRKDRVVPLGERARAWLERYLDAVRPELLLNNSTQRGAKPEHEGTLFLSSYGVPFNPDSVTKMVCSCIENSGIGRAGSCHLFRHSSATHMLENGVDIRFIQQLLGHAKLETTQVYTEVSIQQLQEVHKRTHPARMDKGEA